MADAFTSDHASADENGQLSLFVILDGFEGPIDLLLSLARDQKVDLNNILLLLIQPATSILTLRLTIS